MYVIYLLEYKVNLDKKINNKKKFVKFLNLNRLFLCTCIVLAAILLGGWWAEQELSWGGW
jgi:cytochrome c biogenesis factor